MGVLKIEIFAVSIALVGREQVSFRRIFCTFDERAAIIRARLAWYYSGVNLGVGGFVANVRIPCG